MNLKSIIIVLIYVFMPNIMFSQTSTIAGNVLNIKKEPLSYASVFIANKPNIATFTDGKGYFRLEVQLSDSLFISHIGYESIKVAGCDFKNQIFLKENTQQLKEFTLSANKRNKLYTTRKLGTYWSGADANWIVCGHSNYALQMPNEVKRVGVIKKVYYNIRHGNNKSNKYKHNKVQLRVRIYSISTHSGNKQSIDLLKENVFVSMRQSQKGLSIDLEKYNIPFPKEGIMLGFDIMGYLDDKEKLIEESSVQCKKNICLKQTDRYETKQSFYKGFNSAKWYSVSEFPKPQTNEFITVNAMFGAEVIFEEDE